MRRMLGCLVVVSALGVGAARLPARAACCYFSAVGQDVAQPAQKAFITWHPVERIETFTVQPKFEGNAKDFGMVIPTPTRPRLYEMPREFFNELAVFTILKPVPKGKFRSFGGFGGGGLGGFGGAGAGGFGGGMAPRVAVLESGLVGSLDYKIVMAEQAGDLYAWLKENNYAYAGDEATLDYYIRQRWVFTVMKIDPMQQKRNSDGTYSGSISPTRFDFATPRLIYPLRITRRSIKKETEALFYVQAPTKVDLPGPMSYQFNWVPMWRSAMRMAYPNRLTEAEQAWIPVADRATPELDTFRSNVQKQNPTWLPAQLDWAKQLNGDDMAIINRTVRFDRQADLRAINNLPILRGHLREGQWLTKIRKTFRAEEMTQDLEFIPASLGGQADEMEYTFAFPTSPP